MQGNSLLEQYKGIDLSRIAQDSRQIVNNTQTLEIFDTMLDVYRKDLREMINRYYFESDHVNKMN